MWCNTKIQSCKTEKKEKSDFRCPSFVLVGSAVFKPLICLLWVLRNSIFPLHLLNQWLRWTAYRKWVHVLCKKHAMLCNKSVSSLTSLMPVLRPLTDLNPKQHVPLEEYAANLKSMIQYLKSVDITEDRIILITPPPLQESAWEKECLAKGKRVIWMGGISAFYGQSVSCWSQADGWLASRLCHIAVVFSEWMEKDCYLVC